MPAVTKECPDCGTPFQGYENAGRVRKYCSHACAARANARPHGLTKSEYNRRINRRVKYGLDHETFTGLLTAQDGKCAICAKVMTIGEGNTADACHVDHCHETGKVRGLLCGACNLGIGKFQDDANRLLMAAAYLIGHEL